MNTGKSGCLIQACSIWSSYYVYDGKFFDLGTKVGHTFWPIIMPPNKLGIERFYLANLIGTLPLLAVLNCAFSVDFRGNLLGKLYLLFRSCGNCGTYLLNYYKINKAFLVRSGCELGTLPGFTFMRRCYGWLGSAFLFLVLIVIYFFSTFSRVWAKLLLSCPRRNC